MKNLLLISNSTLHGSGYLDHCSLNIQGFLNTIRDVLFVPYARPSGITYEEFTKKARERFERMGFGLKGIHELDDPIKAVENAESIFIGGGNTFLLLNELYRTGIICNIRRKVEEGMLYIGASAGSNVAGKTIMTTNDMPIVYPPSFEAIGLVPFTINPHYINPDPNSTHQGETRETRIKEYHVFNNDTVVGLREGTMIHVRGDKVTLLGGARARIFRKGQNPIEHDSGDCLDFLLQ